MVFTWNPGCSVCFIRQVVLTCAVQFYLCLCDGQIVLVYTDHSTAVAYRGGGGGWGSTPRNSEVLQSRTGLQIERRMFSVPIPTS
jgi:hypothetical protein